MGQRTTEKETNWQHLFFVSGYLRAEELVHCYRSAAAGRSCSQIPVRVMIQRKQDACRIASTEWLLYTSTSSERGVSAYLVSHFVPTKTLLHQAWTSDTGYRIRHTLRSLISEELFGSDTLKGNAGSEISRSTSHCLSDQSFDAETLVSIDKMDVCDEVVTRFLAMTELSRQIHNSFELPFQ